jgi:signal transduction histidine kinase/DNA-binding response OmpR family regulator
MAAWLTALTRAKPRSSREATVDTVQKSLSELIVESLRALLPVTVLLVWLWCVVVVLTSEQATPIAYAVFAINLLSCAFSYRFHARHLAWAVVIYLAGSLVTVTLIALAFPSPITLCLYVLVILTTAMLTNARALSWVTGLCAACVIALSLFTAVGWMQAGTALVLVLLSALTAWLGSRRLFTALQWTLSMTAESQKNAADAQWHRGEVQRVLKNLDEAYVRLEHTNQALLLAREAAEKAYRFKSEFVVNVSHELRTPLNLIIGFSEMMATAPESYGSAQLPKAYRGDIMAIYRSGKHLSDLINDVLDLSQIEAGRMPIHKTPTDLAEVVRESADIVRGLIEARGLACEVVLPDELPLLNLDRTRIRQVLLNLLTNATRFTDHGFVRAAVHVAQGQTGEPEAIVSVQDSGHGIPPEKLSNAFEAFSQLHESQIRDGSGMGLAVSKQFVALHGGRMWIESAMGKGTCVSFTLPIRETPTANWHAASALMRRDGAPTVLVLHDDARALDLLNRYVEGFQFVFAAGWDEARTLLTQTTPLMVLADAAWLHQVQLNLSGLEALTTAPILSLPLPGMRRVGAQLGAADYLTKPVTREALVTSLVRLNQPINKLLIVDNDPHVVRLLARMVKAEWPEVQAYESFSGGEALEAMRAQLPDAVLLDLLMPDVSGYDVIEAMRRDTVLANTPVIIVSARGEEEESTPIYGEVRLDRRGGYSITQMLHMLEAVLNGARGL